MKKAVCFSVLLIVITIFTGCQSRAISRLTGASLQLQLPNDFNRPISFSSGRKNEKSNLFCCFTYRNPHIYRLSVPSYIPLDWCSATITVTEWFWSSHLFFFRQEEWKRSVLLVYRWTNESKNLHGLGPIGIRNIICSKIDMKKKFILLQNIFMNKQ